MAEAIKADSFEAFLAWERKQAIRHEYLDGQVLAMTGASRRHERIAGGLFARIFEHLRGTGCEAYKGDLGLRPGQEEALAYPDIQVTCDARDLADPRVNAHPLLLIEVLSESTEDASFTSRDVGKNLLLIEVLSESTEARDRGQKWQHYRAIEELREYVLIEPVGLTAEILRRNDQGQWVGFRVAAGERMELASIGLSVRLGELP